VLLVNNLSPMRVGFWAIVSVVAVTVLRAAVVMAIIEPRRGNQLTMERIGIALWGGLRGLARALELGARNAVAVSMACAVAGIIVGVVGLTGLGLKFSSMMVAFSGGNMVLALIMVLLASLILGMGLPVTAAYIVLIVLVGPLIMVLLASLILGMGLPVTAAYIVLIVLVGPALHQEFGIPLLIAHLVVFWYSQDSNVTPPIALAGFAASAVAGSKPMETSVQAWKFAKGLYLIPAFMVFNPEIILGGDLEVVLWTGFLAIISLVGFAAAIEGYLFTWMNPVSRVLVIPGVIATFYPEFLFELVGAAILFGVIALNWLTAPRAQEKVANSSRT